MKKVIHHRYPFMVLVVLLGSWIAFFPPPVLAGPPVLAESSASAGSGKSIKTALDLGTAISEVARANIPAVVHIDVTQQQEMTLPMFPFGNDPFFRFFFNSPNTNRKFQQEMKGFGSGMIMDVQGHILTNNHVVGAATEIQVILSDGSKYPAKLVGSDPKTDISVIQIEPDRVLPHVTFGNSDEMGVGNWVIAIGHPRGLDQTVTQGFISAKHRRNVMDPNSIQDFLQTDAAINPGNSGGPLLNLQGEVIGVNTAIVSQSGGFEGIGFAIPSNMAIYVAEGLIEHGKVVRGWMGVGVQELTPELAKSFGLKGNKGTLIADVVKDGPADHSGLERGDVVIAFQGKEISNSGDLLNEIAATQVDEKVRITVIRKGIKQEFTIKIGSYESAVRMIAESLKDLIGAVVRPVETKDVQQYKLHSEQGVVIIGIDSNGPLGRAGFEQNDIILEINGQAVDHLGRFVDLISTSSGDRIVILALDHRTGRTGYVQVELR